MDLHTAWPDTIDDDHPIIRQEYAVFTPPMDSMFATISTWIDQRATGGYIYGPSRYGKSRAVKWFLKSELEAHVGRTLPLIFWVREDTQSMREREFWNALLLAAKYEFIDPTKPKTKAVARYLLREHLETLAQASRSNYVILLIDEAQRMTYAEWTWLLGLQNMLDADGFRLTTVSVGSHALGYVPDYFALTGNAHITARFFPHDAPFFGLRSVADLTFVLEGYDLDSEWPKESGLSFLQYFAPDDFSKGRRLAECAPQLWSSFDALRPPGIGTKKNETALELPMLHVALTVESILKALGRGEAWEEVTSPARLLSTIAKTGFTAFLRHISHDLGRLSKRSSSDARK